MDPPDQDDLVDVLVCELGVLHRLLDRLDRALHEVGRDLVECRAHQRRVEVLRPRRVRGHERQADRGLRDRGQFHLGLLGGLEQALQRLRVGAQVDAVVPLELIGQVVDDSPVEVVTAKVRVASRGPDLDDAVADVQHAHVERPAAQVEDQDGLVLLLVQAVGQRGCRWLVNDPEHLKARDLARVLGRLALCVVEVRGNRDDCLGDFLADLLRRIVNELAQHECRDLLRRVLLAVDLEPRRPVWTGDDVERDGVLLTRDLVVATPDEPLGRVDRAFRVQDGLPPCQLPDKPLALRCKGHHRWRST